MRRLEFPDLVTESVAFFRKEDHLFGCATGVKGVVVELELDLT